jgi:hypothetical protein
MASQLPPIPTTSSRNSFFHQAATASAWMPLVLLGVQFLVILPISSSIGDPFVRQLLGIGMGCAMLLGLVLGIVALCGIPKYGTKGLLVKTILGIAVPVLLILLAIPPILHARDLAHRRQMMISNPDGGPIDR